MSKYLVIAAALIVFAVSCNKKEEGATATTEATTEQAAPAEAAPMEATDAPVDAPAEAAPEAPEAPAAQ